MALLAKSPCTRRHPESRGIPLPLSSGHGFINAASPPQKQNPPKLSHSPPRPASLFPTCSPSCWRYFLCALCGEPSIFSEIFVPICQESAVSCKRAFLTPSFTTTSIAIVGAPTFLRPPPPLFFFRLLLNLELTTENLKLPNSNHSRTYAKQGVGVGYLNGNVPKLCRRADIPMLHASEAASAAVQRKQKGIPRFARNGGGLARSRTGKSAQSLLAAPFKVL